MKKIPIILFFILILGLTGERQSHASILQELDEELNQVNHESPPYPYVLSSPIEILPQGSITIGVGEETYYYDQGNFYQMLMREQKYVQVPPPIGAVIFSIPQGYELMSINGFSYYEYNGVYYKRVLDGFKVIFPPAI